MSDRTLRLAIAALSALGVAIAAYLTAARFAHATLACATGGCETVQSSRYSKLAGVPVAVLGLGTYLFLLGSAFTVRESVRVAAAAVALAGTAFAAYLLYVQAAVLHAYCQWCLASDVAIAGLAALTLVRALREPAAPLSRPAGRAGRPGAARPGAPRPGGRARGRPAARSPRRPRTG